MNTKSPFIPGTKILDDYYRDIEPEVGALGFVIAKLRGVDQANRTAEFVISSGEIDRYGEIVDPKAFDKATVDAFMQNPVALAAHQHAGLGGEPTVIGEWLSIKRDGDQTIGVCEFDTDDLSEKYWGKVLRRKMRACSIGFIVRAWEMREVGTGESKRSVRVFTKIELIEVSIVAVPANRQALMKAAGFGDADHKHGDHRNHAGGIDYAKLAKALIEAGLGDQINNQITRVLTDPLGPVDGLIREVVAAVLAGGSCGHDHDAGDPPAGHKAGDAGDDDALTRALQSLAS